jgi:hypothetical protein
MLCRKVGNLHEQRRMPTVMRIGPYSCAFFSSDRAEKVHVHVKRDRQIAKFWLDPVLLAKNRGFSKHELDRVATLVVQYQVQLLEAWYDYFDS